MYLGHARGIACAGGFGEAVRTAFRCQRAERFNPGSAVTVGSSSGRDHALALIKTLSTSPFKCSCTGIGVQRFQLEPESRDGSRGESLAAAGTDAIQDQIVAQRRVLTNERDQTFRARSSMGASTRGRLKQASASSQLAWCRVMRMQAFSVLEAALGWWGRGAIIACVSIPRDSEEIPTSVDRSSPISRRRRGVLPHPEHQRCRLSFDRNAPPIHACRPLRR